MNCAKKDTCVNYRTRCFECMSISDICNPYPRYINEEEHERRLTWLLHGVPEMIKSANESQDNIKRLATYLVNNGVRVEDV